MLTRVGTACHPGLSATGLPVAALRTANPPIADTDVILINTSTLFLLVRRSWFVVRRFSSDAGRSELGTFSK